jgi:hypothetical protein
MALSGALIAPIVFIGLRVAFAEPEDPQAFWGWIDHWAHQPRELAIGSFPFLIPGAVFGFTWSARRQISKRLPNKRLHPTARH